MAWWWSYKPPKAAKGGIKAQSKRGAFGTSWWARRWVQVLESFQIGARLDRGRSYARRGQVLDIHVEKGAVRAAVQGSRSRPYKVEILIKTLSKTAWSRVVKALSDRFIYVAQLVGGEMPQDIEEVFSGVGLSLFPDRLKDLESDCSCPDWSNPCKHVAAVFYLLGEEFDRDPFLIFKLRGLSREELLELLGGGRTLGPVSAAPGPEEAASKLPETLTAEAPAFWEGQELPGDLLGEVRPAPVPAALPKRLGKFPFWRGKDAFLEALEPFYLKAAPAGLEVFLGLPRPEAAPEPEPAPPVQASPKSRKTLEKKAAPKKGRTPAGGAKPKKAAAADSKRKTKGGAKKTE